jgi:hypothetical protein
LIPAHDITVVWGEPKSGKTFWVLDMSLHVALGRPYRGRRVEQGPVCYCALEGAGAFPARLEAASRAYRVDKETVPFWFSVDRFTFGKLGRAGDLIRAIGNTIEERPRLVVIDTLNRSLSGSENSDEDMTNYTKCVEDISKTFDCSVIVVHHCGVAKERPRGHTSLTGTCAAQLKVARATKGIVLRGHPMMISTKVEFSKDGPEGDQLFSWVQPVTLGIDEYGQSINTCYIAEAPQPTTGERLGDTPIYIAKALALLQDMIFNRADKRVTSSEWREECISEKILGRTRESSRRAFYKAQEKLQADGIIKIEGQWIYLVSEPSGSDTNAPESNGGGNDVLH